MGKRGQPSPQGGSTPPHKLKAMCRDSNTRSGCPRGNNCNYSHYEDDMERYNVPITTAYTFGYRTMQPMPTSDAATNGNFSLISTLPPMTVPPPTLGGPLPMHIYQRYPPPRFAHVPMQHLESYNVMQPMHSMTSSMGNMSGGPLSQDIPMPDGPRSDPMPRNYGAGLLQSQGQLGLNQGLMMPLADRQYYGRYGGLLTIVTEEAGGLQYRPEYLNPMYQPNAGAAFQPERGGQPALNNIYAVNQEPGNYSFDERLTTELLPEFRGPPGFPPMIRRRVDSWPAASTFDYNRRAENLGPIPMPSENTYDFNIMRDALPQIQVPTDNSFEYNIMRDGLAQLPGPSDNCTSAADRRAVGTDRFYAGRERAPPQSDATDDEHELEEEMMALERRIDTEFKSTD